MKLSILIPHTTKYVGFLERLEGVLAPQVDDNPDVEVIKFIDDGKLSIGAKRNWLLQKAKGDYIAFIDSDDLVSKDYIGLIMKGVNKDVDCCSLRGRITFDGQKPHTFIHSNHYTEYFEEGNIFYRPPNHLNCIRTSIANRFKFPKKNHGEDTDWAMKICRSGLLKTEHWIEDTIYFYEYRSKK